MKLSKAAKIAAAAAALLAAGSAAANEELAKKSACLACHTVDKKLVGPAYKDIAAKRAGDNMLIRSGTS